MGAHHTTKRKRDADEEAEPFYYRGRYAIPYAAHGVPFGSSTGLDPITQGLDAATQGVVYGK